MAKVTLNLPSKNNLSEGKYNIRTYSGALIFSMNGCTFIPILYNAMELAASEL